jgi:perosamine synthetase
VKDIMTSCPSTSDRLKEVSTHDLQVPLARPWFSELEPQAASKVIESGWLISGPQVAEFERRFAYTVGTQHAIAVNSGSSALLVVQAAAGIGPGDEVIVPDMTFISTATSSMFLGARPVFADIEMAYYTIKVDDIEQRITPRTKAIIPVHYAGHTADMDGIMAIAEEHGLTVIEDAAEAHLSTYHGGSMAGSFGHAAIFSFTPSKPMTTGEGGMIVTNDDRLAERCRLIRNYGDTARFKWDILGFNFRMAEIMGAIGLLQLDIVAEAVRRRRKIAESYRQAFADLSDLVFAPRSRHPTDTNYQLYTIRLNIEALNIDRDTFIALMAKRGISTRLYYPCLHRQRVFAELRCPDDASFPESVQYAETAVSLPIYPTMTDGELSRVIESVYSILVQSRR